MTTEQQNGQKTAEKQDEKKWDGSGPTPQQLADVEKRLAAEKALAEGGSAEDANEPGAGKKRRKPKTADKGDAPYSEPPAVVDSNGKAYSFMDLLNNNRRMTDRMNAGELEHVDEEGNALPPPAINIPAGFTSDRDLLTPTHDESKPGPGEKPVQPLGSAHDAAGKNLHAADLPAGPVSAVWKPNTPPADAAAAQEGNQQQPEGQQQNNGAWTTKPK